MSCAIIFGVVRFSGTVSPYYASKDIGLLVFSVGAGPQTTLPVVIPYLKSTDTILIFAESGGSVVGPITTNVANSGLVNATLTATSAGAVAGSVSRYNYWVLPGRG